MNIANTWWRILTYIYKCKMKCIYNNTRFSEWHVYNATSIELYIDVGVGRYVIMPWIVIPE